MKKILLLLAFIASFGALYAQNSTLRLNTGQTLQGTLIDATDTTILFLQEGLSQAYNIPVERIKSGTLPHRGKISVQDNKIVIQTGDDIKRSKQNATANNPNYALGKALKVSGATSLGIGIPCLAAGLATCIAGNVMYVSKYSFASDVTTKSQLLEASYYLLPIGASLTIVGIPLYVEGKKIMDIKLNYTGNGVGVAMNF